jgi:predicted NACHT family NTPase
MFDGLDEILDDRTREDVVIDIINFTTDYPKVRVLVTSRVIGTRSIGQSSKVLSLSSLCCKT